MAPESELSTSVAPSWVSVAGAIGNAKETPSLSARKDCLRALWAACSRPVFCHRSSNTGFNTSTTLGAAGGLGRSASPPGDEGSTTPADVSPAVPESRLASRDLSIAPGVVAGDAAIAASAADVESAGDRSTTGAGTASPPAAAAGASGRGARAATAAAGGRIHGRGCASRTMAARKLTDTSGGPVAARADAKRAPPSS